MRVKVWLERENQEKDVELRDNSKVIDLLNNLNINPTTVIISKEDTLITESATLNNEDKIKVFPVVSGG